MAAFGGVLTSGLLRGVMIGAAISIVQLMRQSSRPHVALLGQIPGTRRFSDCDRHTDNELVPNVMIFRPESGLVYFNVDNVCEAILRRIRAQPTLPKLVILDLSAAARVDMQSVHTLAGMAEELIAESIEFHVVEARSSVRDRLRREGVAGKFGGVNRFTTVADVIDHFQREHNASLLQRNETTSKGVNPMPFDKFVDIDRIDDERRKSVTESIRIINVEELNKLAGEIFHSPDDPWRQTLLQLIAENPGATFYRSDAGEGVVFLYCRDVDKGLWYLSGSGMGPLSARARQMMNEAIAEGH
jgi:hypothetical protein